MWRWNGAVPGNRKALCLAGDEPHGSGTGVCVHVLWLGERVHLGSPLRSGSCRDPAISRSSSRGVCLRHLPSPWTCVSPDRDTNTPPGSALAQQSLYKYPQDVALGSVTEGTRFDENRKIIYPLSGSPSMAFLTYDQQCMISRGMKSLVSLAEKLSSSSENPGVHKAIQEDAHRAWEEMKAVENQLEMQKQTVDSQYVGLIDKRSHLNSEMIERKLSQDLLQIQLKYHEKTNERAQEMVTTAQKHLRKLTELQEKVRQEEKWHKIARNIALLFMPFSTLMAGIVSAIFQTSLYTAQRADQELQKAIDLYETKVSEYEENICKCDIKKEETELRIKADEIKIEEIKGKLSELENVMVKQEQFLRNLGLLVGDLKVLEEKLETDSDYESAWEVLKKKVVKSLEGDQGLLNFLDRPEIKGFVWDLKKIIQSRADI
ncbi:signal recognition particle protein [Platysternon megacephalum]|uniref:Signal recognition particle protein n=1 Tax=Platysternon megacephalum TaxID=55544 RepID=A0A4D9DMF5_9SAUR|nr:signal recognition particle protein [Platysternon megacephalum]